MLMRQTNQPQFHQGSEDTTTTNINTTTNSNHTTTTTTETSTTNNYRSAQHLSKRTRIELSAAVNDHNYNLRYEDHERQLAQQSSSSSADGSPIEQGRSASEQPLEAGQWAAYSLIELASQASKRAPDKQASDDRDSSSAAAAKRYSEPIEMDTSGQKRLSWRHFKRRPSSSERPDSALGLNEQFERGVEEALASMSRRRGRLNCSYDDDADADDDEDDELAGSQLDLAFREQAPPQLEDEMMFELQQVDDDEPAAAAQHSQQQLQPQRASSFQPSPLDEASTGDKTGKRLAPATTFTSPADSLSPATTCNGKTQRQQNRQPQQPFNARQLQLQQLRLYQHQHQHHHHREEQQQQLRLRAAAAAANNPVKMRTIFSCMWPGCSKNCGALADIERHVRSHLGPKQYDSIGEEDFYYEETEVDEATYLAVFRRVDGSATGRAPLSPSHNSDGQSFTSSSPATSPVCSTDSSSASSDGASSASAGSSLEPGTASQLCANSIDWNHFLADHNQLLRASSAAGKWLPSGVFVGPNGKQMHLAVNQHQHHQEVKLYRASTLLSAAPGELAPASLAGAACSPSARGPTALGHRAQAPKTRLQSGCHVGGIGGSASLAKHNKNLHSSSSSTNNNNNGAKNHNNNNKDKRSHAHQSKGAHRQLNSLASSGSSSSLAAHSPASPDGSPPAKARASGALSRYAANKRSLSSSRSGQVPDEGKCERDGGGPKQREANEGHAEARDGARSAGSHRTIKDYNNIKNDIDSSNNHNYQRPQHLAKQHAPTERLYHQSASGGPGKRGRRSKLELAGARALQQQANNHLKHNLSQRFFHNQSTSPHEGGVGALMSAAAAVATSQSQSVSAAQAGQQQAISCSGASGGMNGATSNLLQSTIHAGLSRLVGAAPSAYGARRVRGENKKCRKVYGMERRDLWCIQCKWKKACTRFGADQ